jgi:transcriptional/translational regulatory protein YebC/TACO1
MFTRKGIVKIPASVIKDLDQFELEMIDFGLEELVQDEDGVYLYTSFQDFGRMHKVLEEKGIEGVTTEVQYVPTVTKELSESAAEEVKALLDKLEEDDDVQSVFHTMG